MRLPRFRIRTMMIAIGVTGVLLAFEPALYREVEMQIRYGSWGEALVFLVIANVVLFTVGVNFGLILLGLYLASGDRNRK